jgi:hypothetical protein
MDLWQMDISTPQTFHLVLARTESEEKGPQFPQRAEQEQSHEAEAEAEAEAAESAGENAATEQQQPQQRCSSPLVFDAASVEAARMYLQTGDIAFLPVDTQIVMCVG